MAKHKAFGGEAQKEAGEQQKMAKVVVSKKLGNNKYAFKESMVPEDDARDFIKEKKG